VEGPAQKPTNSLQGGFLLGLAKAQSYTWRNLLCTSSCNVLCRRCAGIASSVGLPLIGNGDVFSPSEWQQRLAAAAEPEDPGTEGAAAAADGCGVTTAMIGRAALIKPWIFTGRAQALTHAAAGDGGACALTTQHLQRPELSPLPTQASVPNICEDSSMNQLIGVSSVAMKFVKNSCRPSTKKHLFGGC
jgi:hypothetical protein